MDTKIKKPYIINRTALKIRDFHKIIYTPFKASQVSRPPYVIRNNWIFFKTMWYSLLCLVYIA